MPSTKFKLRRLEKALDSLKDVCHPMDVSELDGLIAGIIISPELIKPSEWLMSVWGKEHDDDPIFTDLEHVQTVIGLVMEHYNIVAHDLAHRPLRYSPIFSVDTRNDDVMCEAWLSGFMQALQLRPKPWLKILSVKSEASLALSGMFMLDEVYKRTTKLSKKEAEEFVSVAPDLIPEWVVSLNEHRKAAFVIRGQSGLSGLNPFATNLGRNDPCHCGSGKKFKYCCGAN